MANKNAGVFRVALRVAERRPEILADQGREGVFALSTCLRGATNSDRAFASSPESWRLARRLLSHYAMSSSLHRFRCGHRNFVIEGDR